MNKEYINPFVESSISVISQVTGIQPLPGEVYLKTASYRSDSVVVLIGLVGKIQGSVVMSLNAKTACKIASAMMGGYTVTSLDEITKSAVAELGNMIMGNTSIIFSKVSMDVTITPPTVLTGDNINIFHDKSEIFCVPLHISEELLIELDISYRIM